MRRCRTVDFSPALRHRCFQSIFLILTNLYFVKSAFHLQNHREEKVLLSRLCRVARLQQDGQLFLVSRSQEHEDEEEEQIKDYDNFLAFSALPTVIAPFVGFLIYSVGLAVTIVAWEDYACSYLLPSRMQRTTSVISRKQIKELPTWGTSTVRGMGFGREDRLLQVELDAEDDAKFLPPSYNEVMLRHREERVMRWKEKTVTKEQTTAAIHVLLECLKQVKTMEQLAADYQWESVQVALHSYPLTQMEEAASRLRVLESQDLNNNGVVGFDWGSCAWRHCGALADAQESLDELDHLLGVLEPFEAIFCLDIVERSLRDMLTVVPWSSDVVNVDDLATWKKFPPYEPRVSHYATDDVEDAEGSTIDDAYFKALMELRIDDEFDLLD